jgi:hypothetical protein
LPGSTSSSSSRTTAPADRSSGSPTACSRGVSIVAALAIVAWPIARLQAATSMASSIAGVSSLIGVLIAGPPSGAAPARCRPRAA